MKPNLPLVCVQRGSSCSNTSKVTAETTNTMTKNKKIKDKKEIRETCFISPSLCAPSPSSLLLCWKFNNVPLIVSHSSVLCSTRV